VVQEVPKSAEAFGRLAVGLKPIALPLLQCKQAGRGGARM